LKRKIKSYLDDEDNVKLGSGGNLATISLNRLLAGKCLPNLWDVLITVEEHEAYRKRCESDGCTPPTPELITYKPYKPRKEKTTGTVPTASKRKSQRSVSASDKASSDKPAKKLRSQGSEKKTRCDRGFKKKKKKTDSGEVEIMKANCSVQSSLMKTPEHEVEPEGPNVERLNQTQDFIHEQSSSHPRNPKVESCNLPFNMSFSSESEMQYATSEDTALHPPWPGPNAVSPPNNLGPVMTRDQFLQYQEPEPSVQCLQPNPLTANFPTEFASGQHSLDKVDCPITNDLRNPRVHDRSQIVRTVATAMSNPAMFHGEFPKHIPAVYPKYYVPGGYDDPGFYNATQHPSELLLSDAIPNQATFLPLTSGGFVISSVRDYVGYPPCYEGSAPIGSIHPHAR